MSTVQDPPPDTRSRNLITRIEHDQHRLSIDWADGHRSDFHHVWLRDNCFCPNCGDTWSGRRYVMLTDFSLDVHPKSAELDAEGNLVVSWSGDGHPSHYGAAWLRRHCYSPEERHRRSCQPVLWGRTLSETTLSVEFTEASRSEGSLLRLHEVLRDYGIALVRGVPSEIDGSRQLAELFGPLDDSGYGEITDLSSVVDYSGDEVHAVDDETGTYQVTLPTASPVPPHNDEPFHYAHPGVKFLHCVEPNREGGGYSIMVDGFKVADDLRRMKPECFELLSRVPQTYNRIIDEADAATAGYGRAVDFRGGGRAICLDVDGEVSGFRYHSRATAPLDLPEELMEPMYRANYELVSRLNEPKYQLRFRLEAGDAVVFDNHRVLHAREGFSGRRHLRLFHVKREEFHNRLRLLSRKLGRDGADLRLSGGALS